jgi:hypothetical protein
MVDWDRSVWQQNSTGDTYRFVTDTRGTTMLFTKCFPTLIHRRKCLGTHNSAAGHYSAQAATRAVDRQTWHLSSDH